MHARRILPLVLLLLALPLPLLASAEPYEATATAAGSARFVVTDETSWPGTTRCDTGATFVAEVSRSGGILAWDAPACDSPEATDATVFSFWCTDACFQDCRVRPDEVSCDRRALRLDGSDVTTAFTLARDGTFTFLRAVHGPTAWLTVEAHGTLVVATWPDEEWG